jgi:hypothetical protein
LELLAVRLLLGVRRAGRLREDVRLVHLYHRRTHRPVQLGTVRFRLDHRRKQSAKGRHTEQSENVNAHAKANSLAKALQARFASVRGAAVSDLNVYLGNTNSHNQSCENARCVAPPLPLPHTHLTSFLLGAFAAQ